MMRKSWPAPRSSTLALALLSACGGTTHEVEASGLSDASTAARADAAREAAAHAQSGGGDATAPHDADDPGPLPQDAGSALPSSRDAMVDAHAAADASRANDADTVRDARLDGGAVEGGARACSFSYVPTYAVCEAAPRVAGDATVKAQDTASGARGDCAVHASGTGGRNLYYRLLLPSARNTRVLAAPTNADHVALVRMFADCRAQEAERGARGLGDGRAELCLRNDGPTDREVFLAVGRYSGESMDLTLAFDLTVETLPAGQSCGW